MRDMICGERGTMMNGNDYLNLGYCIFNNLKLNYYICNNLNSNKI